MVFTVIRLRRVDNKSRIVSLASSANLVVRLRGLALRDLRLHSKVLRKKSQFFPFKFSTVVRGLSEHRSQL